jgi:VIT1/CCC1 family predicted Fe2+/Mn2+ transporter
MTVRDAVLALILIGVIAAITTDSLLITAIGTVITGIGAGLLVYLSGEEAE